VKDILPACIEEKCGNGDILVGKSSDAFCFKSLDMIQKSDKETQELVAEKQDSERAFSGPEPSFADIPNPTSSIKNYNNVCNFKEDQNVVENQIMLGLELKETPENIRANEMPILKPPESSSNVIRLDEVVNENKPVKLIKKKSLDFLANSLMKKAIERSQTQSPPPTVMPSQPSSCSSKHCQIVQESKVLSPRSPFEASAALPNVSRNQSGLGLILASYCSSDEEL